MHLYLILNAFISYVQFMLFIILYILLILKSLNRLIYNKYYEATRLFKDTYNQNSISNKLYSYNLIILPGIVSRYYMKLNIIYRTISIQSMTPEKIASKTRAKSSQFHNLN